MYEYNLKRTRRKTRRETSIEVQCNPLHNNTNNNNKIRKCLDGFAFAHTNWCTFARVRQIPYEHKAPLALIRVQVPHYIVTPRILCSLLNSTYMKDPIHFNGLISHRIQVYGRKISSHVLCQTGKFLSEENQSKTRLMGIVTIFVRHISCHCSSLLWEDKIHLKHERLHPYMDHI